MVDRPASLKDIIKVPLIIGQATISLFAGREAVDFAAEAAREHEYRDESFAGATSSGIAVRQPGRSSKARRRSSYLAHTPGVDAGTSNHANTIGRSSSTSTEDDLSLGSSSRNKRSVSCSVPEKPVRRTGRRNTFLQRASTNYGGSFDPKAVENVYQVCRMLPQFVALVLAMAACELCAPVLLFSPVVP